MKEFWRSRQCRWICVLAAVLFSFMICSAASDGEAFWVKDLISSVAVPLQKGSTSLARSLQDVTGNLFGGSLAEENEALKEECDELRRRLLEYQDLKRSNIALKELLQMEDSEPDYQYVEASIIGTDPDYGYAKIMIDKGKRNGIAKRDIVTTPGGLVGRVEETGTNYAVVMTLLHPQFKIGAYLSESNRLGVVSGDSALSKEGQCRLEYLEEEPVLGDLVATSGSGGDCPRGMVIGTVQSADKQKSGTTYSAELKPANEIAGLTNVFVITGEIGQKDEN